jgi:predicted enzyme related to lactoylglutathione lyase
MHEDGKLDYLELPAGDLPAVKAFYAAAFGWTFTDWGPGYASFNEGLDGGFYADAAEAVPAPLPILYAHDLEAMLDKVTAAGAQITRPIFPFPGGRRFHFRDPAGNELAVWTQG